MKRCPQCNRVELDDTLAFCRADGTALISDSVSVSAESGTVKFGSAPVVNEIETSIIKELEDKYARQETQAWRVAGKAFQKYASRRQKQQAGRPRRILADFLIGAHAL